MDLCSRKINWLSLKNGNFFYVFCILFLSLSRAHGFEFPVIESGETGYFLIDAKNAEKLVIDANYGSQASGYGGVCYGIDRLNFTLLSRVSFVQSAQIDSDEIIFEKLVSAHENGRDVTIFSSSSSPGEFMQEMHARWRETGNPINRAIESIFQSKGNTDLSRGADPTLQALGGYSLTPPPSYFARQISGGIPVGIGIFAPGSGHALTIYGFKESNTGNQSVFYVLESNTPGKFGELVFLKNENHWYYKPWKSKVDIVTESMASGRMNAVKGKFTQISINGRPSCRYLFE